MEESGCLQAKVYLQREVFEFGVLNSNVYPLIPFTMFWNPTFDLYVRKLFTKYEYGAQGRPKFGISLGLFVDCLNTFSAPGHSNTIEIQYPGPDMELLLKYED